MRTHGIVLVGAVGAMSVVALVPARAAAPPDGRIDHEVTEVSWTGSVPVQTVGLSGVGCQPALPDPTCDFFALEVGDLSSGPTAVAPGNGARNGPPPGAGPRKGPFAGGESVDDPGNDVYIGISTDEVGLVEFDLYVYDDAGAELARSTDFGSNDAVELHDLGPGTYTVGVQSPLSQDPTAEYRGVALVTDLGAPAVRDPEQACGLESLGDVAADEPTGLATIIGDPLAASDGLDTAQRVSLDVLVLLDAGMPEADARAVFARATASYEPLGIDLVVVGYEAVQFGTDDASALIAAAKDHVGGVRPDGVDIVEVMTATDIQQLGQTAIAGLADCIGGIAHDDRSFLVAEGQTPSDYAFGPVTFGVDANATVTAHEIGHLLGGQHHYGNCAEGVDGDELSADGSGEGTLCTLMFNAADFIDARFGSLNAAVVRGMTVRHAAP